MCVYHLQHIIRGDIVSVNVVDTVVPAAGDIYVLHGGDAGDINVLDRLVGAVSGVDECCRAGGAAESLRVVEDGLAAWGHEVDPHSWRVPCAPVGVAVIHMGPV